MQARDLSADLGNILSVDGSVGRPETVERVLRMAIIREIDKA